MHKEWDLKILYYDVVGPSPVNGLDVRGQDGPTCLRDVIYGSACERRSYRVLEDIHVADSGWIFWTIMA